MMICKRILARPVRQRRTFLAAAMLVLGVLTSILFNTTTTLAASPAEAMVERFGNRVIKILASNNSTGQQEKKFRKIFLRNADINTIGRFTLGKYARTISSSQRKTFNQLLSRFIVKVFIGRMRGTKSTGLKILGTTERKKGRDYLVKSLVNLPSAAPIRVNWRIFKNKSGRLKLFDISIEGLWLAQEQRSIFVNIISRSNGKISALLTHLKQQIAKES
jgi:phospholipid transport system substrate-binding protein